MEEELLTIFRDLLPIIGNSNVLRKTNARFVPDLVARTLVKIEEFASLRVEDFPDEYLKGIPEAYLTKEGSNQTVAKVPRSMVHSVEHTIDVGSVVTIDWKNVLLLSGPAGGGKSTAVDKLVLQILGDYYERRKKEDGVTVVLLPVTLPKLKSPLDSVFEEGCKYAFGGALRDTQVHELIDLVQAKDSKVELVFLLDAYDELPSEARGRNLWRTNNLERFRDQEKQPENHPKVLFTSRSELFAGKSNYSRWFLPVEAQTPTKDEESEARLFFDEIRIIPFGEQRLPYTQQHVALRFRDAFLKKFLSFCEEEEGGSRIRGRPRQAVEACRTPPEGASVG